ncbi:alpha/beta fold hydrolase [Streptomyces lydicus]|uniref:alpha/beta fold hydrolase n=1 Tax=Streptomyces lydicus TaxID=47763 RepID=UPI000AFB80A5|nr:alpha/beta hydrolase [Streptomyces lydicus]MDC7340544.1 alpha/beta hydrolase [Streptomyces lydicus]UEG89765.1 alpha/beta hydrolase [Streptomyces lydicus]
MRTLDGQEPTVPHPDPAGRPGAAFPAAPPVGRRYDLGHGRQLMLHRSGSGGPAVVFLPGAGLVGLDYLRMHDRVAELTGSVLYDRAGTGWSSPAALPRTATEVVDELRALLRAAAVPGPFVLVGHSLGGAYARNYAHRFPDEVAGLLLLDPFHEDLLALAPQDVREQLARMNDQELPEATPEQLEVARGRMAPLFAAWPEAVREPLIDHHLTAWRTAWLEGSNVHDEVAAELRRSPGLPDVPLAVLTATGHDATQAHLWSEAALREINEAKTALHARLAASVPRGVHRVLDDAGHGFLHEERPDAVLAAVTDLLGRAGD